MINKNQCEYGGKCMFEILKSLQPNELVACEYNRYSSHNQDDGNSIEAQQNAIENFA